MKAGPTVGKSHTGVPGSLPLGSAVALLLLLLFFLGTRWGESYVNLASKTWHAWRNGVRVAPERRRLAVYDATYPVLLYARELSPPDATILLPPRQYVIDHSQGRIPILASPSSAYSFLYPRVPVHFGDPSPWKTHLTHVLIWEHWGLDLLGSGPAPGEENRYGLRPWPAGRGVPW